MNILETDSVDFSPVRACASVCMGCLYAQFLTRYHLHRTVYNHRTALALDAMIMDAFQEADPVLEISDAICDAESFLRLSDSLLIRIEHSREANLGSARAIIDRIRRRRLYRFVDETLLPKGSARRVSERDVVSFQDTSSSGVSLRPEDLLIFTVKLNFGRGLTNPVESVYFFKEWEDSEPVQVTSDQFSFVLPAVFEERIVRIYLTRYFPDRDEERRAMESLKTAFRRCVKSLGLGGHLPSPRKVQTRSFDQRRRQAADGNESDASDVVLGIDANAGSNMAKRQRKAL
jgi:deoxynucleoside triphosphate triphosphohydrolase SAMHD1